MSDQNQRTIELDLRGQMCPSTLLLALKEITGHRRELQDKKVKLLIKTDNRDSTITIPDSAINMGYGVSIAKEADYYQILVESE
jgi:TusA-related sulfurtransferase